MQTKLIMGSQICSSNSPQFIKCTKWCVVESVLCHSFDTLLFHLRGLCLRISADKQMKGELGNEVQTMSSARAECKRDNWPPPAQCCI